MNVAKGLDLKMKCLIGISFLALAFVITNGIKTNRANHQVSFAASLQSSLQKKMACDTIKVRVTDDALVLEGVGSQPQIRYAEKLANTFIEKYGNRISNPPKNVRNEIQDKYAKKGSRQVASVKTKRSTRQ